MKYKFIGFIINGSALGLLSFILQNRIYFYMGQEGSYGYSVASFITYTLLIFINFIIQRTFIFSSPGLIGRFIVANIVIMIMVSLLSPIFRMLLAFLYSESVGHSFGFAVAALIGAFPSYLLSRNWVFKNF